MILVLKHPIETVEQSNEVLADAEAIQKKIRLKYPDRECELFKGLDSYKKYMGGQEGKPGSKLIIICHGDLTGKVAGLTGTELAEKLWSGALAKRKNFKNISVLSCLSAGPDVTVTAIRAMSNFFERVGYKVAIKGVEGSIVTDSQGRNFVVRDSEKFKAEREKMKWEDEAKKKKRKFTEKMEMELIMDYCYEKGEHRVIDDWRKRKYPDAY